MTVTSTPNPDGPDNWTQDHTMRLWGSPNLLQVKFEFERKMRLLLRRESAQTGLLTYFGSDYPPTIGRKVRFVFEEALPSGNWYSLHVTAWVPRSWYTEDEFRQYADKAFEYWDQTLAVASATSSPGFASQELYDERVREALDEEARLALQREDPVAVAAVQQDILAQLRNGKSFRTAHHEGGTTIDFADGTFRRSVWGEEQSLDVFRTEDAALQSIRELYDWESRKDSFPHPPPEVEVWKFIRQQLR